MEGTKTKRMKQSLPGRRGNFIWTDPKNLHLVLDKGHFLYDPRAEQPITEEWVKNIDEEGVEQPVLFAKIKLSPKDGYTVNAIVAGRRRLLGIRAANARRVARGEKERELPAIQVKGTERELFARYVIENELREEDGHLAKAQKTRKYLDLIADGETPVGALHAEHKKKAAEVFGVTVKTIEARLKLLATAPKVQEAVGDGRLGWWAASEFAGMPEAEQEKALEEAIEAAGAEGVKVSVEGAKRAAGKGQAKHRERLANVLAGLKEAALDYGTARVDEEGISESKERLLKAALEYYSCVEKK